MNFISFEFTKGKIIICHDELANILTSLLQQKGIEVHKVDKALKYAKKLKIINKSEYLILKNLTRLEVKFITAIFFPVTVRRA